MNINYEIKNCPHCNSKDIIVRGNENQIFGLVSIKSDGLNNTVDLNTFLPVVATICKNCGHVELIHINAKAIQDNN